MKLQFEREDCFKLTAVLFAVLIFIMAFLCRPIVVRAEWVPKIPTSYLHWLWKDGGSTKYNRYVYACGESEIKYIAYFDYGKGRRIVAYSKDSFYSGSTGIDDVLDLSASYDMAYRTDYYTIDDVKYYYCEDAGAFYNGSFDGIAGGSCIVLRSNTAYGKINTKDLVTYAVTGKYPDGFEVEEVGGKETIDEELVIHNLDSYENWDSVVTGLTTYVTWDALGGDTYNPADLYLEAKIDFTTQNKRTGEKQSYTGVPLRMMSDGVKDSSGKFSFVNYQFLSDYCADKGIDDTNLIYLTDNIYCRYAYDGQDGVVYGEWQRVGDVIPTIDDADYSQDLELENMTYKELHPSTGIYQHYVSFDIKDSYDDNTYLLVNADIKWKPALNKTNVATYIPIVEKNDKYLASSGEWSIDVDTLWKNYFDSEGINYSAFSSQWTDKLYFQVVKWSESDNKWYSSAIRYFDIKTQTTGTVGNEWHSSTGLIDKETGEFIEGGFDSSGTFVPGSGNGYFGDSTTGNITDKSYGGIFEGIDLPEGSSVLDYIMALGSALVSGIGSLLTSIGQVPKMIGSVLSFLPDSVITLIGLGIIVAIVLRVLGR